MESIHDLKTQKLQVNYIWDDRSPADRPRGRNAFTISESIYDIRNVIIIQNWFFNSIAKLHIPRKSAPQKFRKIAQASGFSP